MRFSAVQFGGRTLASDGPLSLFVDGVFEILVWRQAVFVDDLLFWLLFVWHGICAGLVGGQCAHCVANAEVAKKSERYVDELMDKLHLERSDKDSPESDWPALHFPGGLD
jgi:hypothetical protein